MEFAIAVVIQDLDVQEERDFDITYGVCLSRSLFIICRICSRATFEPGLLQCSFQIILCRSFLNVALSKFLCNLHVCSSFALDEDGLIKSKCSLKCKVQLFIRRKLTLESLEQDQYR